MFKSALKCGNALGQWKAMVENRTEWRHIIRQTCNNVNEKTVNANERQRDKRRRKENLKKIDYLLHFMLTIYCACTDLCCNRFRD